MSSPDRSDHTVLVANDHEWTARSVETILSADGYRVIRAFTARQALERAAASPPDAFVLDVQLPDLDGMSLCRSIRSQAQFGPALPIILTTAGPSGRQERVAAYKAGAWEFFGQPLDGEALLLKLKVYLEAKEVTDDFRRQSLVDVATGLYSRAGLLRRGRELASEAARRQQPLACLVLRPDLPELEGAVTAAEEVATQIGGFLRGAGRSADAIGRVGPLDFGLITTGAGPNEVRLLARRLNEFAATSPVRAAVGGTGPVFRVAFCSVENAAAETIDPEMMLHRAAAAVGQAEGEGLAVTLSG